MAVIAIEEGGPSSLRTFRYRNTVRHNPAFDGAAFIESWARFVGSAHRHNETRELVLFALHNKRIACVLR